VFRSDLTAGSKIGSPRFQRCVSPHGERILDKCKIRPRNKMLLLAILLLSLSALSVLYSSLLQHSALGLYPHVIKGEGR